MQGTLCTVLEILRGNEFNFNHKNLHDVRARACENICIKSPMCVSCKPFEFHFLPLCCSNRNLERPHFCNIYRSKLRNMRIKEEHYF